VGSDGLAYRFHRKVVERLELTESDFQKIIAGFVEKLKQLETMINI
jgi:hypothetical protein